jgi:hypothetical protein
MKTCSICEKELPLSQFHKRTYSSGNIGYQNKCKKCTTIVRREYYKPHEKTRQKLKISEEQFNDLMKNENCQTCGVKMEKKCIDHCHISNKIRGVLCNNCNTALGLVKDNRQTLQNMLQYLDN